MIWVIAYGVGYIVAFFPLSRWWYRHGKEAFPLTFRDDPARIRRFAVAEALIVSFAWPVLAVVVPPFYGLARLSRGWLK